MYTAGCSETSAGVLKMEAAGCSETLPGVLKMEIAGSSEIVTDVTYQKTANFIITPLRI